MNRAPFTPALAALGLMGMVACTSDPETHSAGEYRPDATVADRETQTMTFTGSVVDDDSGAPLPLAGVTVCRVDGAGTEDPSVPCSVTDRTGAFSVSGLSVNTEHIVRFAKAGYDTVIRALDAGSTSADVQGIPMGKSFTASIGPSDPGWNPGVVVDPKLGAIAGFFVRGFPEGVVVAIGPSAGDGPFYDDGTGAWVPGATSTVAGGWGWYVNLPTGTYELTFTSPTLDCQKSPGGAFGFAGGEHSVRVPVIAGAITQAIAIECR